MPRARVRNRLAKRNLPSKRHETPRPAPGDLETLRAFLNTVERGERKLDKLGSPEDLARWLIFRELMPEGAVLTDEHLALFVRLREALRSLVRSPKTKRVSAARTLRQINEGVSFRLVFGDALEPRLESAGDEVQQAVGSLIRLFADARREERWERFKVCGHCGEIFYDHTLNDTGRWCRTVCGDFVRKRRSRRRRTTGRV